MNIARTVLVLVGIIGIDCANVYACSGSEGGQKTSISQNTKASIAKETRAMPRLSDNSSTSKDSTLISSATKNPSKMDSGRHGRTAMAREKIRQN